MTKASVLSERVLQFSAIKAANVLAVHNAKIVWRESKKKNMIRREMLAPIGRNMA